MGAVPVGQLPKRMAVESAERQLRIAIVYSRIPFPMMRGDQATVAHLISFLSRRRHVVDLYTLAVDGEMDPSQEAWLQSSCNQVFVYAHPLWAKVVGLLRGMRRALPFQIGLFTNPHLTRDLSLAVRRDAYDIVYCYYPRTALAIPSQKVDRGKMKSILALQLSQTLNTRRMAKNDSSVLKRMVFRLETRLMGRFEARVWQKFDRVVLIGAADVAAVKEQCKAYGQPVIDNWVYGAHGTDTDKFLPARTEEIVSGRIVFSGSMLYPPNIQAVLWFVEKVWPQIRHGVPDATFVIQGRDPAPKIANLNDIDGITVTGTVPDVGAMIRSAQVCVNPMLSAGGMQNKLIEYMASGKAVVASSIANEGILAPSDALLIADDATEFAVAVLNLLSDAGAAASLGERARSYVLDNWTWEKHFLDLEQTFYATLDGQWSNRGMREQST